MADTVNNNIDMDKILIDYYNNKGIDLGEETEKKHPKKIKNLEYCENSLHF